MKARKLKLNQKGMTLIEIMIVLIILGGMSTFLITKVMDNFNKAKVNQAKVLISEVEKALQQFYLDCSYYPTSEQGLEALINPPSSGKQCANWGPDSYIKKIPQDPWNSDLGYESDGFKYTITSYGDDGQEGGDGLSRDITNGEEES